MSRFTEAELQVIAEVANLGPANDDALQRLFETFSGVRLFQAAETADRLRAGEAVEATDGSVLLRDAPGLDWTGTVLREVTE